MARKSNTLIIIVGVVAVVAVAAGIAISGVLKVPETTMETMETREPSLSVSSQILEGDQILVDSLFLDKPGYVVIHKDADGKPGAVIGNSELLSGEVNNLRVTIDTTQAGTRVFAMLHYDDGDGVYGFPDEDFPVILEGNIVVRPVTIVQAETEMEQETTAEETSQMLMTEFTIEADDNGFYQDGTRITSLNVGTGETITINFKVRTTNVYFGGLEFKSSDYGIDTPDVAPGGSTIVEFKADNSGNISSYWPSSNRLKATLQIKAV